MCKTDETVLQSTLRRVNVRIARILSKIALREPASISR